MTLHVLTACSRPENLERVARSLAATPCHWHVRFDIERQYVGGQEVKNVLLDEIHDGWVFFLDDDTLMHPKLYRRLGTLFEEGGPDAFVVSQRHSVLGILHAAPENVHVGGIDIGQVVARRTLIGDTRIPNTYWGDGEFWSEILPKGKVVYLDEVLSYQNALAQKEE